MAFGRTFLYHRDYPTGRIFTDEDEFKDAMKTGQWVEAPWLVKEVAPQVEEKAVVETSVDTPDVIPPKKTRAPGRPSKKVKGGK